ncbi:putative galactose mutarotase-like domain superfamily, glycosyl hydrolase, all-beta [Helianthus debilis subsp. tardiflorus]
MNVEVEFGVLLNKHGTIETGYARYPFLKISYCPPSEAVLGDGKSLVVVVYNPIGWKREEVVQFPVRADLGFDFFTLTFNVLAV